MANSATLLSMTTRVRRRADMENTQFVTDTEIHKYLNDSLTELYDLFVTSYQHYVMEEIDTTLDGSGEYFIRSFEPYTLDRSYTDTVLGGLSFNDNDPGSLLITVFPPGPGPALTPVPVGSVGYMFNLPGIYNLIEAYRVATIAAGGIPALQTNIGGTCDVPSVAGRITFSDSLNNFFIVTDDGSGAAVVGVTEFYPSVVAPSNFAIDDFMKLEGISIDVGGRLINMERFMFGERDMLEYLPSTVLAYNTKYCFVGDRIKFTNDVANTPIKIWYIPCKNNLPPFSLDDCYLGGDTFGNILGVSADGTVISTTGAPMTALINNYFQDRLDRGLPAYIQNNLPSLASPQSVGTIESVDVPTNTFVVTMHTDQNFQMLSAAGDALFPSHTPAIDTVMHYLCEGWEEYAVIDAAIKCLEKEESNVETLMRDKEMMRVRIGDVAIERDAGTPFRVTDVNFTKYPNDWYFV